MAGMYDNDVVKMADASLERMGLDYIDMYWIHNPMADAAGIDPPGHQEVFGGGRWI